MFRRQGHQAYVGAERGVSALLGRDACCSSEASCTWGWGTTVDVIYTVFRIWGRMFPAFDPMGGMLKAADELGDALTEI
jgi:hypothetical protein